MKGEGGGGGGNAHTHTHINTHKQPLTFYIIGTLSNLIHICHAHRIGSARCERSDGVVVVARRQPHGHLALRHLQLGDDVRQYGLVHRAQEEGVVSWNLFTEAGR